MELSDEGVVIVDVGVSGAGVLQTVEQIVQVLGVDVIGLTHVGQFTNELLLKVSVQIVSDDFLRRLPQTGAPQQVEAAGENSAENAEEASAEDEAHDGERGRSVEGVTEAQSRPHVQVGGVGEPTRGR